MSFAADLYPGYIVLFSALSIIASLDVMILYIFLNSLPFKVFKEEHLM